MFRKLRSAIDGALSALESRSPVAGDEDVDQVLAGMREELIEAKAAVPRLEQGVEKLRQMQAAERKRAEDCVRRAGQAEEIGDSETLRVAVEFAERHQERARVYAEKISAAEGELALQRRAVDEMTRGLKSAMTNRDVLKVRARRSEATRSMRGGGDSAAARFDRLVEGIEDEAARAEAERGLDEELGFRATLDAGAFERASGQHPGADPDELAERRLAELKRRMAEEGGGAA